MTDIEEPPAAQARRRRADSLYPELAEAFLARLAGGESVAAICRDPEMAAWTTVRRWLRDEPGFSERFVAAREAGGGVRRGGRPTDYDPALGEAICERLSEGESLIGLCGEPGMPSRRTVFLWLKRHADFREAYRLAREVQAHAAAEEIEEMLDRATPQTLALVRLKAQHLRWKAARLAPRTYGAGSDVRAVLAAQAASGRKAEAWDDEEAHLEVGHIVIKTFGRGKLTGLELVNEYEAGGRRFEVYREVREPLAEGERPDHR